MRISRIAALLFLGLSASTWAAPPVLVLTGDGGVGFDSNVSNAQDDDDIRDSSFANAAAHISHTHRFSLYTTALARLSAQGEAYNHFDKLSNAKAVGTLRLFHRPGGGFYTPAFALWGSAAYWEFGSRIRDSNEYRGGLFVLQQITTQVSGRFSLSVVRRESESQVFDLDNQSIGLNLDWLTGPKLTVYGGYQFIDGDIVSSATPSVQIVRAAEVVEADDAFGGIDAEQFAYRLEAKTQVGILGFNYVFSQRLSFDAQAQAVNSQAAWKNEYTRVISVGSLLWRF